MKSDSSNSISPATESVKSKRIPKTPAAKYEGSRYTSLALLVVTILISLVFYASGH